MIDALLPEGSGRRRVASVLAGFARCLDPRRASRGDPGEALVNAGLGYPYRWWLHLQRRRRAIEAAAVPVATEVLDLPGSSKHWEPDAAAIVSRALDDGFDGVYFHADGIDHEGRRRPRIVPTLGPVSRLSPDPLAGSFEGVAPADLEPARCRRIDEVLWHVERRPEPATPFRPAVDYTEVAIVVPSPGNTDFLGRLFTGLSACGGVAEVVVIDNTEPTDDATAFYRHWAARLPLSVERTDPAEGFNYSRANNLGAAASTAPVIAFCNDDIELPVGFQGGGGLTSLAAWLSADGVGVVGPQLRYPDGTIQHGGVVIGLNGLAEHAFTGMRPGTETLIGSTDMPRDVSAVTGAFLVTTREVFDAVGGFDEDLVLTGSDVWFCLRAAEAGWGTAYDGSVHLVHHESAARGDTNHLADVIGSARRWGRIIDQGDPYWSQRLAIHRHEPTLRRPSDPTSRTMLEEYLSGRGVDVSTIASLRTCP